MITIEEQESLFASEALDCLDADDADRLQQFLRRDPEKSKVRDSFLRTASLLGLSVPLIAPDPSVKKRILEEIERISRRPPVGAMLAASSRSAPPRFTFDSLLPWAAVALLALTSAWLWLQNTRARADIVRLRENILHTESLQGCMLWGNGGQSPPRAELIFCTRRQMGKLVVHGLESPPPGQAYQVWLQSDQVSAPVSAGIFRVGPHGEGEMTFRPNVKINKLCKVLISLEHAGGAATAEGPIVLAGNVL